MNLLYVDIYALHLNPSATYLPLLASMTVDVVDLYGPGYCSIEDIDRGILSWIDDKGPYDFILLGANVPFFADSQEELESSIQFLQKFTSCASSVYELNKFLRDLTAALPLLSGQRLLLSCLNYDYYASKESHIAKIYDLNLTILGANCQSLLRIEDLGPELLSEKHYIRKRQAISNIWQDFICQHPERVLTSYHYVLPHEFCFRSFHAREDTIIVPGVNYELRKNAIEFLKSSNFKIGTKWHFYLYKFINKAGVPVFSSEPGIRLYQYLFRRSISKSKYTFTARGGFAFPVRKFFEIPALGSLLLASPCHGYENLGFIDGRDFISVLPEHLSDRLNSLPDLAKCASMALSAQSNILRNHTIMARSSQVRMCLESIVEGRYRGSQWVDGSFTLTV